MNVNPNQILNSPEARQGLSAALGGVGTALLVTSAILYTVMYYAFKKTSVELINAATHEKEGTKTVVSSNETTVRRCMSGISIVTLMQIALAIIIFNSTNTCDTKRPTPFQAWTLTGMLAISGIYGLIMTIKYITNPTGSSLMKMSAIGIFGCAITAAISGIISVISFMEYRELPDQKARRDERAKLNAEQAKLRMEQAAINRVAQNKNYNVTFPERPHQFVIPKEPVAAPAK
jgi:hypothetical protein